MTVTIDYTNCYFIITTFEGNMFRMLGQLERKTYNSYEDVYVQLCDQINSGKSVEVMLGGIHLAKSNVKMWFKKDSTNTWSFNCNVPFCFTSCYNSISNCDAFASVIFTPYTNVSCYKAKTIKFCNPDVPYYITWRYSSIHIKHNNGKLFNRKVTPGSYDVYSLLNIINTQLGAKCVEWYGFIIQFKDIKFMVVSGDLSYFFVSRSTNVISKDNAIKLGIPAKQFQGAHQTITTPNNSTNQLVSFEFSKCPHIRDAMVCSPSVGIKMRIAELYENEGLYSNSFITNKLIRLHFDIPSFYTCGTTSSIGAFLRFNWNCKTNDQNAFVTVQDEDNGSSIIVKNIENGITSIQENVNKDDESTRSRVKMSSTFLSDSNSYKIDISTNNLYTCATYIGNGNQVDCTCMSIRSNGCDCSNNYCRNNLIENFSLIRNNDSNDSFDTILVLTGITIVMLLFIYNFK